MLPPTYCTSYEMSALARPEDALVAADELTAPSTAARIQPRAPTSRSPTAGRVPRRGLASRMRR